MQDSNPRKVPFLDVQRVPRGEWMCRKFALTPIETALTEVSRLLDKCFELDSRHDKVLYVVSQMRLWNGTQAAIWFLRLDRQCQSFLMFALEIYGLRLVARTP